MKKLQSSFIAMASTILKVVLLLLFSSFTISPISCYKGAQHPLDPLSPKELTLVQTIVKKSYNPSSNNTISFHYVGLDEPEKPTVLSSLSKPSTKTLPRRALVFTRVNEQTHEIIVDLSKRIIVYDEVYKGLGYPLLTAEEQIAAIQLPLTYGPFIESAKKRDLNVSYVVCSTFTVGWFGGVERTKRVVKVQCFYNKGTVNLYLRPIEGIGIVVDLDKMKIVEYSDTFKIAVPKAEGTDYRFSKQNPPFGPRINGAAIMQTNGPGFEIDGHTIRFFFFYSFCEYFVSLLLLIIISLILIPLF
jgi:primary-amine oxidase